jgi:hypothetical protein
VVVPAVSLHSDHRDADGLRRGRLGETAAAPQRASAPQPLEGVLQTEIREQARDTLSEHGLADPWRAMEGMRPTQGFDPDWQGVATISVGSAAKRGPHRVIAAEHRRRRLQLSVAPLRHGRGAESDPAAVPGAAAVSAVDGSGAGGVGWLTADLAAEACAFHLTWSRQRGHRPGHQLA